MKKHIPNAITMMNLFSGCIAIAMAFSGNFRAVVIWVIMAAVFDFLDGFAARLLGVSSKIGVELDSLADLVSFGVAPAAAAFVLLRDFSAYPSFLLPVSSILPYSAFLLPVFSALRLAKFNLDDRQSTSFLGLPTPADALFWISYCYGVQYLSPINAKICYSTLGFIVIFSLLMVSEIPMFSLKIKKLQFSGNEKQALLIIVMIAFIALWGIAGVAWGILFYILLSIFENSFGKTKR